MGVQRFARILVIAVFGALLAGCAAEPVPSATPSPTFSTEADAFAAAEATYRAYVDALNQVDLADPATFEAVYEWTTGEANAGARELFSQMHADGWTVRGDSLILRIDHLTADSGSATIGACLDVARVEVEDVEGDSVVAPTRPDIQSIKVQLVSAPGFSYSFAVDVLTGYEAAPPC